MLDLELRLDLLRSLPFNRYGEHTFNQRKKVGGIERVCDKIVRITVENPQKVPQIGCTRNDEHRDIPEKVIRFYLPANLKRISIGYG